ncbi:C40 family peptidase [Myceligenerans pegani]|nr:NlpC/P60 family protein [Myceligenerans sp. TRM 65318]
MSEAAARTGAIAAVTGGMLASVFSSSANAAPAENAKQTVDYGKADARVAGTLADELVDQVRVSKQAETVVEAHTVKVTPYAETAEGKAEARRIAEERRQAELERQRQAELEAQRQAEAEARAAAEAEAAAQAEAEAAAAAEATVSTSTGSSTGQQAVNLAMELVGTPYVLGGSTPSEGLDCSGLVSYVYGQLGISLPRTSSDLRYAGTVVSDPQPGDIVWTSGHVAIYAGNGMIVEAVQPGTPLRYTSMWQSNPTFVRVA